MSFHFEAKNGGIVFASTQTWLMTCDLLSEGDILRNEKLEKLRVHGWCGEELTASESAEIAVFIRKHLDGLQAGDSIFPGGRTVKPDPEEPRDADNEMRFAEYSSWLDGLVRLFQNSGGVRGG